MLSNEEIERHLAAAPGRRLSPEALQEIVSSLLVAERSRRRPWWRGRVPLWQAAVACALVGALGFGLPWHGESDPLPEAIAKVDPPRLAGTSTPNVFTKSEFSYPTDITRWRVQDGPGSTRHHKGEGAL